jgi:hypothetical protein
LWSVWCRSTRLIRLITAVLILVVLVTAALVDEVCGSFVFVSAAILCIVSAHDPEVV